VEPHRDVVHVIPVGELDIATTPLVDARLAELHDAGFRRFVLDLRQTTFIDVRGVRLLLSWTEALALDAPTALTVMPAPPGVQRIFDLTATAKLIPFHDPRPERRFARRRLLHDQDAPLRDRR
jgi:anti-anti-sigma factor